MGGAQGPASSETPFLDKSVKGSRMDRSRSSAMNEYDQWSELPKTTSSGPLVTKNSQYVDTDTLAAALGSCANIWGGNEDPPPPYHIETGQDSFSGSYHVQKKVPHMESQRYLYTDDDEGEGGNEDDSYTYPDDGENIFDTALNVSLRESERSSNFGPLNALDLDSIFANGITQNPSYALDSHGDFGVSDEPSIYDVTRHDSITTASHYTHDEDDHLLYTGGFANLHPPPEITNQIDYFGTEIVTHTATESLDVSGHDAHEVAKLELDAILGHHPRREAINSIYTNDDTINDALSWTSRSRELWSPKSHSDHIAFDDYGPWHNSQHSESKIEYESGNGGSETASSSKFPTPPKAAFSLKEKRPMVKMLDSCTKNPISPVPVFSPPMTAAPLPYVSSREERNLPSLPPVLKPMIPVLKPQQQSAGVQKSPRMNYSIAEPTQTLSPNPSYATSHQLLVEGVSKTPSNLPPLSADLAPLQPVRRSRGPPRHCR